MQYPDTVVPLVVTSTLFTSLAFILVSIRVFTRTFILKVAGIDDYLSATAMAASIGFIIVIFYQIQYGLGTPSEQVQKLGNLPKFLQCLWATIPVYNLSLTLTKISIVFQYKRIFTTPKVVRFCWIMIGILVVYGFWTVIGSALMCIPVQKFWDIYMPENEGYCMNKLQFWFSNAALNIITDCMIFAIPMPLLKQLQLPKKQKIGLMFVFGFGAFVCITSIIRMKSLYEISVSPDTTLDGVSTAIWSGIEINVALGCSSLPALKPFIGRFLPHFLSSVHTDSNLNTFNPSNYHNSHKLTDMRSKNDRSTNRTALGNDETIVVERTVHQTRDQRASMEGSEKSLVNWKVNVYVDSDRESAERKPNETV